MFHTVYNSYETDGRDYIGKHSTDDINDGYLGSFKDKTFEPNSKIIIAHAKTAEGALWLEIQFQKVFDVVEDPQFANRAYQTSTGFYYGSISESNRNRVVSEETRKKISESQKKNQDQKCEEKSQKTLRKDPR